MLVETEAEFEQKAIHLRAPQFESSNELYKWAAGILLALVLFLGGFLTRGGGITRAEAEILITSAANPYVQDKPAIEQRLKGIESKLDDVSTSGNTLDRKISRICIALGIDPDSTDPYVRRKR